MYEQIREHIRENEIPEALDAMDKITLSAELKGILLTLQRRWRIYEDRAMGNLEEERLLRIEENQIVNDLITLLNRAEDSKSTVRQREVKLTYTEREAGANAGTSTPLSRTAKEAVKSKGVPLSYLLGALGLVALLAFGWWAMQPDPEPVATPISAGTAEDQQAPPSSASPDSPPSTDAPPSSTTRPTLSPATTTIRDHRLTEPENEVVIATRPTILQNTTILEALKKNTPLMTEGSYVPMAIGVYFNEKAPTAYNEELTKTLGSFIRARVQREVSMDVLTKAFHSSDMRETIVLRSSGGDARLKSTRAKYLFLCDIRQVTGDKGYLRMCLYDVGRQKGFTRGKSITIRSGKSFQEKEMLLAVQDYLTEMKKRGLFE